MSDYVEGDTCKLVLYNESPEDKLKKYPKDLIDMAQKITDKWSEQDRKKFANVPPHMQEKEMVRLMKKYESMEKVKENING